MSGWRLRAALLAAGFFGGLAGIWSHGAAGAWLGRETTWLDSYEFMPEGCSVLRTLVVLDRATQRPSHEAFVIVCPQWVYDELEAGRRLRP